MERPYSSIRRWMKEMKELDIPFPERKELVREASGFMGYLFAYPLTLNHAIEDTRHEGLRSLDAYEKIDRRLQEHTQNIIIKRPLTG